MTAGGAHCQPQSGAQTDGDETIETTTTEAHGDERMIAIALTETAHAIGRLAAHLEDTVTEGTEIDIVVTGENDLQVPQTRIAGGADIAAIDTATTVNATASDPQGAIEVPGHDPVLPNDPEVHRHYSEAAHCLHNPTRSQMK